jgi:uncharacterized membrane protein (UPF0127 family)
MAVVALALALALPHGTALIATERATVSVQVEIAETDAARSTGLMYRKRLAPRAGMVFLFPSDTSSGFWMKNTKIPLSIAFYDSGGRILRIMDMTPCRADPCRVYEPKVEYRAALEVNRGAFRRWHVRVGDTIQLRRARRSPCHNTRLHLAPPCELRLGR